MGKEKSLIENAQSVGILMNTSQLACTAGKRIVWQCMYCQEDSYQCNACGYTEGNSSALFVD